MKILIVDDQATIRRSMCLILNQLGLTGIQEAEDGYEAMTHLRKAEFDLIISDVHMPAPLPGVPAKSGLELLETVRLDPSLKKIPFLIISADSDMKTVVKAMQIGVNGYIIKPFTKKAVKEKLDALGFEMRIPEDVPQPEPDPTVSSAQCSDEDFLKTTLF